MKILKDFWFEIVMFLLIVWCAFCIVWLVRVYRAIVQQGGKVECVERGFVIQLPSNLIDK